jgi:predicted O-methyltransferase YrrM
MEKLMSKSIRTKIFKALKIQEYPHLRASVFELNNIGELKKLFNWDNDPILNDQSIHEFGSIEDINERRIRDAESIGTVCRNIAKGTFLEIGTSSGHGTALMAQNAPQAKIYTVNIPPQEANAGEGGKYITHALEDDEIGIYYKKLGLKNIIQILANTATWNPDIGTIDVAFIDGCHDTEFVFNDTRKILKCMKPGSFILWHDFNLELAQKRRWIRCVCLGIEKLYEKGLLKGRTFHLKDSFVGIHRVE